MRKLFFAALCCLSLSTVSLQAQDDAQYNRRGRGRGQMPMMMAADTAITNHMELSAEQLAQIADLNAAYQEQMTAQMGNRNEKGKKLSREEREARQEQMKAITKENRQKLRVILGDESYIAYLEQLVDRRPMMGGGPRGGNQNFGGERPDFGGERPDFGGGGFPGGGF